MDPTTITFTNFAQQIGNIGLNGGRINENDAMTGIRLYFASSWLTLAEDNKTAKYTYNVEAYHTMGQQPIALSDATYS